MLPLYRGFEKIKTTNKNNLKTTIVASNSYVSLLNLENMVRIPEHSEGRGLDYLATESLRSLVIARLTLTASSRASSRQSAGQGQLYPLGGSTCNKTFTGGASSPFHCLTEKHDHLLLDVILLGGLHWHHGRHVAGGGETKTHSSDQKAHGTISGIQCEELFHSHKKLRQAGLSWLS